MARPFLVNGEWQVMPPNSFGAGVSKLRIHLKPGVSQGIFQMRAEKK